MTFRVVCIDDDFTDFIETFGDHYNLPVRGQIYTVAGINHLGAYYIPELSNPLHVVCLNPLQVAYTHFAHERFEILDENEFIYNHTPPFYEINLN